MKPPTDTDRVLFGLRADATAADLKRAYRRAALGLHPDQNPDPAAAVRFRELTDAYRRLEPTLATAKPKPASLPDRTAWFLADARALMKRWPAERWQKAVDGLPAIVWLSSALEVLAKLWIPPGPVPSSPAPDAISECIEQWTEHVRDHTLAKLSRADSRRLDEALTAAEARIKALTRPKRSRQ